MHAAFFLFYLSGTLLHELAHFLAGALTNARPAAFSVWPRRDGSNRWILGSVSFKNIRWYNAAFVGLAPITALAVPPFLAIARLRYGVAYSWLDILIAVLIAPIYLSALPSREDMLIALRSWPYAAGAMLIYWLTVY
ncbi:hypothetical protein [Paucimonas lemoignei]|nr:hypothetical protein [Paucimonas lemoignei]